MGMTPASAVTGTVFLIRHGATALNFQVPPRIQGNKSNHGLSPAGKIQAERTGTLLGILGCSKVYSSPLRRAQQTAELIAARCQAAVVVVEELIEVDAGQWEEMTWQEVGLSAPLEYAQFIADPSAHGYLGGENLTDVLKRVLPAVTKIAQLNRHRQVAIVSHNVVNRVVMSHLLGLSLSRARELKQDNCGINVLRYQEDRLVVETLNSIFHLAEHVKH